MRKKRFDVIEKENRIINIVKSMEENKENITYYSVAKKANCTRNFLYNSLKISSLIEQKRKLNYKMNFFGNKNNIIIGIKINTPDEILSRILNCLKECNCLIRYIKGNDGEEPDIVILDDKVEKVNCIKVKINIIDDKVYYFVVFPNGDNKVYNNEDDLVKYVLKYYEY
ncbi:MAG: hypothetical protein IKN46_03465 [Acholeplasmatales bacterium]|nr:hypothetical protein [Acholeplasmatales bacterium]